MAVSKVVLNGTTLMDTTQKTVTAETMLNGTTALKNDGTDITGNIATKTSSNMTVSGATVTAPAGYYASSASKSVATGTAGTPTATKGTVSNHQISITPSVTNTTGYITGSTINGTAVTVTAAELASGNKTITQNGTDIDVVGYSTVTVNVPSATGGSITQDQNGYLVLSPDGGGGGGGGLEYEEGTFTPTSDINNYSISFSNSHANRPYHIIVTDVTGTPQSVSGGLLVWMCSTWYDAFGQAVEAGNETAFYGRIQYAVGGTSYGMSGQNFTLIDGTSTSAISRYVSNTGFQLYTITCKANRTYKWIAVWPPTT